MAAITNRTQVDPRSELDESLAKAAGVVETLMHDPHIPRSANNAAWAAMDHIERARSAFGRLHVTDTPGVRS